MTNIVIVLVFVRLGMIVTSSNVQVSSPQCNQLSFVVEWSNMKPYIYNSSSGKQKGLFVELLDKMIKPSSKIFYKTNESPHNKIQNFKNSLALHQSNNTENTSVVMPVMLKTNTEADPCEIKIHHSRGPVYIVKRNAMKPLTQLGRSFINGGQIIGLTLILTVISGVFMWILDRHKNPMDFPPSFILGAWQGFWWAFVTMTTVGYGDTAPKSVPARLYSILWMLLGMVAFSVLTANFTSSLTYEIQEDLTLFGKTVAVLNGSLAKQAAVSEGAKYKAFNDVEDMITAVVKGSSVKGILLDRHVAVSNLKRFRDNVLEIGRTVDYEYYIGLSVRPPHNSTQMCEMIKKCADDLLRNEAFELATLKILSESVSEEQNKKESSSLFDDYEFLIILLVLFAVLVSGGLVWEYFYYKPKMERINKVDGEYELEGDNANDPDKAVLFRNEVEELCEECRTRVENIVKEEGKQRLQSLQTVVSPLDGFAIIGNQLSSIPGVSSIRKIGSELPSNVQYLTRLGKKNRRGKLPPID